MGAQNITAIIYDKHGKILSVGKNSYVKTHPLQAYYAKKCNLPEKVFVHAEIASIIKLMPNDVKRANKIFISRIGKSGKYLSAKPCPICATAIEKIGIKHVEYT